MTITEVYTRIQAARDALNEFDREVLADPDDRLWIGVAAERIKRAEEIVFEIANKGEPTG